MPVYEYLCSSCGKRFEKMVRFSEMNQQPECPICHSLETRKQISMVASQFGGSYSASSSSCGTHGSFS